jgi:hypothetical protein
MGIDVKIKDGWGTGTEACVTPRGQLVTAPLGFSEAYVANAITDTIAFNFLAPKTGKRFVVTDILLYANKGVGAADAAVNIFEATSASSVAIGKSILEIEMLKNTSRDITGLNLILTEGVWLNITTDDNTIFATVMGYYVNA